MTMDLEQSVREAILSQGLVRTEDRVLLAVSGGADSVVMAAVLRRIHSQSPICHGLAIGHVNHHLRGSESDEDERFVCQLADQWNLPVLVRSVDVSGYRRAHKQSMETAARELRLIALAEMAVEAGCNRIAAAHHADDQSETMIHRLLRGTGFRGLCGIAPIRRLDNGLLLIRPMLDIARAEILDYARQHNFRWREDSSNASIDPARNRIRHLLLPQLDRNFRRLRHSLQELAEHCRRFQRKVENECEHVRPQIIQSQPGQILLDRAATVALPEPIRVELIRQALVDLGCGERNLGTHQYQSLDRLIRGPAGRSRHLPGGFYARTDSASLILARGFVESSRPAVDHGVELPIPGTVVVGRFQIESRILSRDECDLREFLKTKPPTTEWFDFQSVVPPLRVRRRRPGDRFIPLGQTEGKKIGKFLTAQKTADALRRRILIVEDARQILWAAPLRISHSVRIQSQTRRILEITIRPIIAGSVQSSNPALT